MAEPKYEGKPTGTTDPYERTPNEQAGTADQFVYDYESGKWVLAKQENAANLVEGDIPGGGGGIDMFGMHISQEATYAAGGALALVAAVLIVKGFMAAWNRVPPQPAGGSH